jgi:hypothetical protein
MMSKIPTEPLIDELWHKALMDEIEHMLDELEQEILDNANKEDTGQ